MSLTNKEFVKSLRKLADFYEEHPKLQPPYGKSDEVFHIYASGKDELAEVAKAFGTCEKTVDSTFFRIKLKRKIGEFVLEAIEYRENVCERIVTGTKLVQRSVPVAYKEVVESVDVVEWKCPDSLLQTHQQKEATQDVTKQA